MMHIVKNIQFIILCHIILYYTTIHLLFLHCIFAFSTLAYEKSRQNSGAMASLPSTVQMQLYRQQQMWWCHNIRLQWPGWACRCVHVRRGCQWAQRAAAGTCRTSSDLTGHASAPRHVRGCSPCGPDRSCDCVTSSFRHQLKVILWKPARTSTSSRFHYRHSLWTFPVGYYLLT